jgi:aminopeptidase N/puromycin-sensitive aminopeptidase
VTLDVAPSCVPWVFANAGGQGYYRTAYSPELLRSLAPHLQDALSAPERLVLAADEWALVRAGRHDAADYLTLAAGYGGESSSGVLTEVVERLTFIHEYLTTPGTRGFFQSFVRTLLASAFDSVGFAPSTSDHDDRRQLRAVVVEALGTIGEDERVVKEARTALDRSLEAGAPALDPTLREAIVKIAAAHGDQKLYDAFVAAAERATSPSERDLYLLATARFRDAPLVDRALGRALSNDVRPQDTARYLAAFFANPSARPSAWAFVKSNWSALEPKLRGFNAGAVLARAVGSFCDAAARDDVKAFFGGRRLPGTSGALSQSIERIENCIELRESQTRPVSDWLTQRQDGVR